MNLHDPEKLERLVHETLRALPNRRAPHSLENRVMAALAARAALPWWQQSFLKWPTAAKIAFVLSGAGAAKVLIFAAIYVLGDFESGQFTNAFSTPFSWIALVRAVATGLSDGIGAVMRAIPPFWLYGGLAVIGSLYVALFGLGAAAYRTLYVQR